jgi:homoserine dehydrogenase
MNKLHIGLVGFGNVGSGVAKFLRQKRQYIQDKTHTDLIIKMVCDRSIDKKNTRSLGKIRLTTDYREVVRDPDVDVIVELLGGKHPAKEVVSEALRNGKHVVTANKELIALFGRSLFELAQKRQRYIYYESAVMAGVPVIKTITEGITGNEFRGLYGIINGTCNYILSQMSQNRLTFERALADAQAKGFAESNPTLDINGMDSAHKLNILVSLTLGKFVNLSDIYVEGITQISHDDIEYAESLDLVIKLLAIAKKDDSHTIEARVHPTLLPKSHPLAAINGIDNALYIDSDPLGDILLSGAGAGQMTAASGVVSDLINLASRKSSKEIPLGNLVHERPEVRVKAIDEISTKFYIRLRAIDKPGVLSQITGILGKHGISINSVSQRSHNPASTVPVIMLTDFAPEREIRLALEKIHQLSIVKSKPVAIRMENLEEADQ